MSEKYKALSLGWGIQSFTIAAMIALKELEPVDVVIHADTTHESKLTYDFRNKWEPWLIEHGINVITITNKDKHGTDVIDKWDGVMIPANTMLSGKQRSIKRECTDAWKRNPIKRYLQQFRNGKLVEIWIGISIDEWTRARTASEKYITNYYPLIEKNISRSDCINWLINHNIEVPSKSACTFCPFKRTSDWVKTKLVQEDWEEAVRVDNEIRYARMPGELYLHQSCKPLKEANIYTKEESGQVDLFDLNCESGYCFI